MELKALATIQNELRTKQKINNSIKIFNRILEILSFNQQCILFKNNTKWKIKLEIALSLPTEIHKWMVLSTLELNKAKRN